MSATQRPEDLEMVLCGGEATKLPVEHRLVEAAELVSHVDQVLVSRQQFLHSVQAPSVREARQQGHAVPTTVVLIEDTDGAWGTSKALGRWVRVGRSSGVNVVLGCPTAVPPSTPVQGLDRFLQTALASPVLGQMTATIFGVGDGRATLRTFGQWDPARPSQESVELTDFTFVPAQFERQS